VTAQDHVTEGDRLMRTTFRIQLLSLALVLTAGILLAGPARSQEARPLPPTTRAILDALAAASISVSATDSVYEDRVEVTWPMAGEYDVLYRVLRKSSPLAQPVLLSVLSSEDSSFVDTTGDPGHQYIYLVRLVDVTADTVLDVGSDLGSRRINPPGSVDATDGTLSTRVRITWSDLSFVEAGYRISRRETGVGAFVEIGTAEEDEEFYDDLTAVQGTVYDYRVVAFDADDFESRHGQDSGWAGYVVPPATVRATDGTFIDRVRITWVDQSSDETGFNVYRDGSLIGSVGLDHTQFDDLDSLGAAHVYEVAAVVDTNGSPLESVRIPDSGIGGPGTLAGADSLDASVDEFDDHVHLAWNDGADYEDNWIVERDGDLVATLPADTETFDDPDAEPGVLYGYAVYAQADSGGFSPAVQDSGRRAVILAPQNVTASDGSYEGYVEISWESSATSVVLFKILRDGTAFRTVNGTARSTVDTDIASDTTHTYCVVAVTAFEDESPSACDDGYRKIAAPTGVDASDDAYEDRVLITWKDNSKIETGYNIYRRVEGVGSFSLLGTRGAGRTAYVDTAAAPGVVYEYEVAAVDDLGTSTRDGDTGSRLLAEPTYVEATDGAFEQKVALSWLDNSRFETGYEIRRRTAGSAGNPTVIDSVGADVMEYDDTSISFGVEYEYTIVPFDDLGASTVGDGATDTGFSTILPPLSVNASDRYSDKIILTWVDQSGIETGYLVERRELGSSTGATVLDTTAAGAETYQDNTAQAGVEYEYCVTTLSGSVASDPVCDDGVFNPAVTATEKVIGTFLEPDSPAANATLGKTLALSGDRAIVGAPGMSTEGRILFFERTDAGWEQAQIMAPPDTGITGFGRKVVMDGDYAAASANNNTAYVYQHTENGGWAYYGQKDYLGQINMALKGDQLALCFNTIYYPNTTAERAIILFTLDGDGGINSEVQLRSPAQDLASKFGDAMAFGDGTFLVGAPGLLTGLGAFVYIYEQSGGAWPSTYTTFLSYYGDGFGASIAVDGHNLLIGSPTEGFVYYYNDATSGAYQPVGYSWAPGVAGFGTTVGFWGRYAVVGAPAGTASGAGPGEVLIFEQNADGTWPLYATETLVSSTATSGDDFGRSLAVGKGTVIFGGPQDDVYGSNSGTVVLYELNRAPGNVTASDGTYDDRIQVKWEDRSTTDTQEDGFNVYRNGVLLETTAPNIRTYNDFEAQPGRAYEYAVTSVRGGAESDQVADFGRRAPNGAITGRVETQAGAAVSGVNVCLSPTPNNALLFDGTGAAFTQPVTIDGDFTLEFWVNPADASSYREWVQFLDGTEVRFSAGTTGGIPFISAYASSSASTPTTREFNTSVAQGSDTWYHFAFVVDQSTDIECYLNGQLYGTTSLATETQGTRTVRLGGFTGRLDDVRIWGTLRTASQVLDFKDNPLTGAEDGLLAYWNLDEGTGDLAADVSPTEAYASLEGGAHWSQAGAPLTSCAVTDLEGNYALGQLRYGASTTFKVSPGLPNRTFEPGFKTITLSTDAPVQNEVAFRDISSYTVTGFARLTNVNLDPDAYCFAPDVEILVDGDVKGTTDGNGNFAVALTIGEHTIEPRSGDHTFSPATLTVDIAADTSGVEFVDTTVRTLSGRIGGGCDLDIGSLEIEITSEDGCFSKEDFTGNGEYEIQLPPQTYFLTVRDVTNIPAGVDKADILQFFDDLGTRQIDLAEADTTLDFVYRAPIKVRITGFDAPLCQVAPRNVPVLAQGNQVPLTIEVYEDYGGGNECPVDSASVTIYDEILDEADNPTTVTVENGVASYTTIANTPNVFAGRRDAEGVDRSYQKPITAVADVGGIFATETEWVIVTGQRPRVPTFTSVSEGIPLLILRDPPGDNSSAYVEQGTTLCTEIHDMGLESLSTELTFGIKTGIKFEKGSPFWSTETETAVEASDAFTIGISATEDGGATICATTNETFSTSSDEIFAGENGDVYLGVALNLVFAKTDVLEFDPQTCQIIKSEAITVGGDGLDPFETTYLYTADHIRNVVIPQLREIAASTSDPDSATYFESAADNWQANHLDYNAQLKQDADFVENRSFSAGADYSASATNDTTDTFEWSVKVFTGYEGAATFKFEESGNGTENQFVIALDFEYTHTELSSTTNTRTVGYTLSDDDVGDFFSVDIKDDPDYGTPVFDVVSGTSSCPWEPWYNESGEPKMQPRDKALLAVEPPEIRAVPPEDPAVFTLSLTNDSQSGEAREYILRPIQTTNPGGAILKANGNGFAGGLSFFIGPQQTQEVTLSVERGPRRYLYEDMQIQLVSPCEYERWQNGGPLQLADTVSITVEYDAPCSEVTLFRPQSGWIHNAADGDTLEIILKDFEFQISEQDSIQSVGAEYRLLNTDTWYPIEEIARANLPTDSEGDPQSVSILWDISNLPQEGKYEVRGYTRCAGGSNFSIPATGLLDQTPPVPFGAPQPADSVLSLGEAIKLTFQESILCESVNSANVTLVRLNADQSTTPVQVDVACDGKSLILTPVSPTLAQLEGKTLIASVTGVKDLAGNLMEARDGSSTETWEFQVRQSAFTWARGSLVKEVAYRDPGTVSATLVNGTAGDVTFQIEDGPPWLVPDPATATILTQQSLSVAFDVADTLSLGSHQDTLRAVVRNNLNQIVLETPLFVQLEVVCRPPVWNLDPADFEQSMTVVAQVSAGGQLSIDPNDRIAAFVGNDLRGVAGPEYVSSLGDYLVFLTVYSDRASGESVRFKIYDDSECRLYPSADRTVAFVAEGSAGTPAAPVLIVAQDAPPASINHIAVNEGWTWISFNLRSQDMSVDGLLDDLNPASGDVLKSQAAFSQFDPNLGWVGGVATLNNTSGYLLKMSEAGTIAFDGSPAPPDSTSIPLTTGWNWIAYVPQVPTDVNTALADLSPSDDDVIKGQYGFAQYLQVNNNVKGWYGNLQFMEPGLGYKLKLKNATNSGNAFRYPVPPPAAARIEPTTPGPHLGLVQSPVAATEKWTVDPGRFQYNMTLTASVEMDGAAVHGTSLVLAAFVGDEIRGVASLQEIPGLPEARAFLMVYGNAADGEALTLRVYDPAEDRVLAADPTVDFAADAVVGDLRNPFMVSTSKDSEIGGPGAEPRVFHLWQVRPNPLPGSATGTLRFSLPTDEHVTVKLFDVRGREVRTLLDEPRPAGDYETPFDVSAMAAGVYFYRFEAGPYRDVGRVVVLN
jgi:fibronectin type 3 domain-containing protein